MSILRGMTTGCSLISFRKPLNFLILRSLHIEVVDSKGLAPDKEKIQDIVCKTYGVSRTDLFKSRRGVLNEPRNVSIFLIPMIRNEGLIDICKEYSFKKYSFVSSVIESVKKRIKDDKKFRTKVNDLNRKLTNSQPEN